jgi:hypothetical protein
MTMGHIQQTPTLSLPGTLTAARLKVALTLNAAELNTVKMPEGKPRLTLRICLPDRTLSAEIATKSRAKRGERSAKPVPTISRSCRRAASSPVIVCPRPDFPRSRRRQSRRRDQKPRRSIMGRQRSVWRSRRLLHTRAEDL